MLRPIPYKGLMSMKTRARSSLLSGLALSSLTGCAFLPSEMGAPAVRPAAQAQPVVVWEEPSQPARVLTAPVRNPAEAVRATTPEGLPIFQVAADPRTPRAALPAPPSPAADRPAVLPSPTPAALAAPAPAALPAIGAGPSAATAAAQTVRAVPPPPPAHDFPWIAGAVHVRAQEETTFGVGSRMFGRLFAKVEFASGASSPVGASAAQDKLRPRPAGLAASASMSEDTPASSLTCTGVTCLDAARDSLLRDAERKGWKVMLNRRIALQQSFMFQREDRMVWIEVKSAGGSLLDLEYGLIPVQGGQK